VALAAPPVRTPTTAHPSPMGDRFSRILPLPDSGDGAAGLYVGPVDFVAQGGVLRELGIDAIVTLLPAMPSQVPMLLAGAGIDPTDRLVFPLEDRREAYVSLLPGIHMVVDWIHARRLDRKTVLIHCDAGLTRSPTIATAYLMKYGPSLAHRETLTYRDALCLVTQRRGPSVDTRLFERELLIFEHQLRVLSNNPNPNLLPSNRSWTNLMDYDLMSPPISPAMTPVSLHLPNRNRGPPEPPPLWGMPSSAALAAPNYASSPVIHSLRRPSPTAPIPTSAPPVPDSVPRPVSPLTLSTSPGTTRLGVFSPTLTAVRFPAASQQP